MAPTTPSAITRADLQRRAVRRLAEAGVDTPAHDVRLLLTNALAVAPIDLVTGAEVPVPAAAVTAFEAMLQRRIAREPVSRILGERWFYGRAFKVTPATLDPRPDSETLVTAAVDLVRASGLPLDGLRTLDIGTGTGCLLLSFLAEVGAVWPATRAIGTDVSREALGVAAENGRRHCTSAMMCEWRHGPGFSPVWGDVFDVILCNPPYIPVADIDSLDPEVRDHDPHVALSGGPDGLDHYRRYASQLPAFLPRGWALFEVGAGQAAAVADLLRAGYAPVPVDLRVFPDLAGIPRCVAVSPRH